MRRMLLVLAGALLFGCSSSSSDGANGAPPAATGGSGGEAGASSAGGGGTGGASGGAGGAAGSTSANGPVEVTIDAGPIRGRIEDGIRWFRGIPFAAPPVGDLRWKPPQPVAPWTDVRDATKWGGKCTQPADASSGEDCLYLNVWTPDPPPASPAPVMVFFHGGAFVLGSGSMSSYDGGNLARKGVIVVTINYRLGPLGFLAHPMLAAEDPSHATGTYGLLDQRASLAWVKANAAAFGGDPTNVTIFGESAGAVSVMAQIASPGTNGLFQRAIVESGAVAGFHLQTVADAQPMADDLAKAVGCAAGDLACLRGKDASSLVTALKNPMPKPGSLFEGSVAEAVWWPVVDGVVVTGQPSDALASGMIAKVPTIVGSNAAEGILFHQGLLGDVKVTTEAEWMDALTRTFADKAPMVAARYPYASFPDGDHALAAMETDAFFTCPTRRVARAFAAAQIPTFRYQLRRGDDGGIFGKLGPCHAADIPYVFGNDDVTGSLDATSEPLRQAIMGYWTRFAAAGDPNGADATEWLPFGTEENTQLLDIPISGGTKIDQDACDFWDAFGDITLPKTY